MTGKRTRTDDFSLRGRSGNRADVTTDGSVRVYDTAGGGGAATSASTYVMLPNLNDDFTAGNRSTNSQWVDVASYANFNFAGNLTKDGTPTDIRFIVYFSTNDQGNGNQHHYQSGPWGNLKFDDVYVGSGNSFSIDGKCHAPYMRVFTTMAGNNTITGDTMTLYLSS